MFDPGEAYLVGEKQVLNEDCRGYDRNWFHFLLLIIVRPCGSAIAGLEAGAGR
jgi:hypothetical protein